MNEQGSSKRGGVEPLSESVILSRLRGLEKIISGERVREILADLKMQNAPQCKLTFEVIVWVMIAMGLFTELPIRQVFRYASRLLGDQKAPTRSALCQARKRLGSRPLEMLYKAVVRPLATPQTKGAFYKGLRKVAIDGTVMDVPDREALQHFGRASGSRGTAAFPQIRKVSLMEIGTRVEFAFVYGGWSQSERTLVEQLWDSIPEDSLLYEDRGFFSYKHWKTLEKRCKLLVRINKAMILTPVENLSDGSYLAYIYPSTWYRDRDRQGILVRVIEYTLDDPQRTGHQEQHRLLTNLLDEREYPAKELVMEYHERWEIEIMFDEQKTHQDPRRAEKTTHLRSETVVGIEQELYAISLGHFIVRTMMHEAALKGNMDVDRLSFKSCFQIIKCRLPECTSVDPLSFEQWYQATLQELLTERIPARANRINPRVIKRKMSKWMKCRPEHRKRPPLEKTFENTINIKT